MEIHPHPPFPKGEKGDLRRGKKMSALQLKVGVSKVDITPNYGSPTRVWHLKDARARINDIRHPLYARTIALSDGIHTSTLTSMDVAAFQQCNMESIRVIAREMLPVPVQDIILHNTHQHSDSFIEYEPAYDIFQINDIAFDMDYIRNVMRKVASSICLAVNGLKSAKIGYGRGAIEEGIASSRRILTDDGRFFWRGSRPSEEMRKLPQGHIDPEVGVVGFFDNEDRPIATIYNYACHPSSAGGDSPSVCSADFPGFASDIIERYYGGISLFLHGCSGDINPGKYVRGDSFNPDDRIADARRMGQILAGEVLKRLGQIETQEVEYFKSLQKETFIPVQPEAGNVEKRLGVANEALQEWKRSGADPRLALRKYIISRKMVDSNYPVRINAVALNGLVFGFTPGELFTELGERIKRRTEAELTIIGTTCGADPFYIPTAEAFTVGGYETGWISTRETGDVLVKEITRLLAAVTGKD
jgi:neutral ceramidase